MVLKVENDTSEDTKPILGVTDANDNEKDYLNDAHKCATITRSMSAEAALQLLENAVRVQNIPLAEQCREILNSQLEITNALLILRTVYDYKLMTGTAPDPLNIEPSAPPVIQNETQFKKDAVREILDGLRNNCLLEIDKNGDYIFSSTEILRLSYPDLLVIATSDMLQVSNELKVFSTLVKWSIEECKRRMINVELTNQKAVLRELINAPRYGLMSKKEFTCKRIDGVKGPYRSGLLEKRHNERILDYVKKKANNRPVEELPYKGSLPRKIRSFQAGNRGESVLTRTSSYEKFVINFLTCWTAVFD